MAGNKTIEDYVSLQRGTTYKGSLVGKPGPALLGLGSIYPGGGFRPDYKTYGGECPSKLTLRPGDLFVSLKGATKDSEMIGSIARVPASVPLGRLTQDTVKLVFHEPDHNSATFIYWLLRTPHYRSYCAGRATGSAVVALSREDFLSYPVPSLTGERAHVVGLFEDIEDKSELNRRMNETLEAISRAIFKSWFVDFDPVHAKAEGRQPFGMDAETAAFFPDSFEDSPLGKIPKGWRVRAVGDVIEVGGGSTPSTKEPTYWDGQVRWATPKDLSALEAPVLLDTGRRITQAGVEQIGSRVYPEGTVLLSSRAPIGYLAISEVPVAVNQGMIAMVCKGNPTSYFMLLWTRANMDTIEAHASGTTFQEISKSSFRSISLAQPTDEVTDAFTERIAPLYERIVANVRESQTLTSLRDALLPRLISGQLRLHDFEKSDQGILS